MAVPPDPRDPGPVSKLGRPGYAFVGDARRFCPDVTELNIREAEQDYRPLRVAGPPYDSGYTV